MSRAWSARDAAEREQLKAAFTVLHGADLLLDEADHREETDRGSDPGAPRTGPRPLFARLHAAIHCAGPLPADLAVALRADPALRADFSLLLQRSARHYLPRAAAAASARSLDRREAGGFTLRLIASRAGGDQVYLLIELPEEGRDPPSGVPGPKRMSGAADTCSASEPRGERDDPAAATPGRLAVKTAAGTFLMEDLPPPETRTIRLVKAADDPMVLAVGEPESEIFLL